MCRNKKKGVILKEWKFDENGKFKITKKDRAGPKDKVSDLQIKNFFQTIPPGHAITGEHAKSMIKQAVKERDDRLGLYHNHSSEPYCNKTVINNYVSTFELG